MRARGRRLALLDRLALASRLAPPPSSRRPTTCRTRSAYLGETRGPAELVPVRDAVGLDVAVRDHVVAPQQHAVEGARARHQARAGPGPAITSSIELVDHGVLDAGAGSGCPASPRRSEPQKSRCSLPGDSDCGHTVDGHVEVEVVDAVLVLRGVHGADARASTPSRSRFFTNGSAMRSNCGSERRISNCIGSPVARSTSFCPCDGPARLLQQRERLAEVRRGCCRSRRSSAARTPCVKTSGGELCRGTARAPSSSSPAGQPARRQLGVREVAPGAGVRAVEQVLVRPLEVERVAERLAHARGPGRSAAAC